MKIFISKWRTENPDEDPRRKEKRDEAVQAVVHVPKRITNRENNFFESTNKHFH